MVPRNGRSDVYKGRHAAIDLPCLVFGNISSLALCSVTFHVTCLVFGNR